MKTEEEQKEEFDQEWVEDEEEKDHNEIIFSPKIDPKEILKKRVV